MFCELQLISVQLTRTETRLLPAPRGPGWAEPELMCHMSQLEVQWGIFLGWLLQLPKYTQSADTRQWLIALQLRGGRDWQIKLSTYNKEKYHIYQTLPVQIHRLRPSKDPSHAGSSEGSSSCSLCELHKQL